MFTLGLQGSPRLKGNTAYLLDTFMNSVAKTGSEIHIVHVSKQNIKPCIGCGYCEKKGYCVIDHDDMAKKMYALIRKADVIVIASPVFFYGITSQLKALIDRCQTLWSRKYVFKLNDPKKKYRRGILLSQGASKGKQLFDGLHLVSKYFFDAICSDYTDSLTYRGVEAVGDMEKNKTVSADVDTITKKIIQPLLKRKKIVFVGKKDACRSQMARAFMQLHAGDKIEADSVGIKPAEKISPIMMEAMQEKNIDMAFGCPVSYEDVMAEIKPEIIVTMGFDCKYPKAPGTMQINWDLPDPEGKPVEFINHIRDKIETHVLSLINEIV